MDDNRSGTDDHGNKQSSRRQEDQLAPFFEAWQRNVGLQPSAGQVTVSDWDAWRWIGHRETLGHYEIEADNRILPAAVQRVVRGWSAQTATEIRKPDSSGPGPETFAWVTSIEGTYEPAESFATECRAAVTAERNEELRTQLIAQAEAGIGRLAGTDRFAATARVFGLGEGEDAAVRVEWLAFGADRGEGIGIPFHGRSDLDLKDAVAQVSTFLGKTFGDAGKGATVEAPETVAAPATEPAVEPAPETTAEPAPEAAAVPTEIAISDPLSTPVIDSVSAKIDVIGVDAAQLIRRGARKLAKQHKLDRLPDDHLMGMLEKGKNPFDTMPGGPGPDGDALSNWWAENGDEALLRTAIEANLGGRRVEKGLADLAEREIRRRGELSPAPLAAVRAARGKSFAAEVEHRATLRTGELASMPEKERMASTKELLERINDGGLKGAALEDVAESVALQNLRNMHNEREARLTAQAESPERVITQRPEPGADDAGMGMD